MGWGLAALVLALAGAYLIVFRVTHPLKALTAAARAVGRGQTPEPLDESGPTERKRGQARILLLICHFWRPSPRRHPCTPVSIDQPSLSPVPHRDRVTAIPGAIRSACIAICPDPAKPEPASTGALRQGVASSAIPCGVQGRQ